jgi:hypothetical protein
MGVAVGFPAAKAVFEVILGAKDIFSGFFDLKGLDVGIYCGVRYAGPKKGDCGCTSL